MKKVARKAHPYTDAYRLYFIGQYVTEITSIEHAKGEEIQIEYYPNQESDPRLKSAVGKNRLEAFKKCLAAVIRDVDKFWKNDGGDRKIWNFID